jgi:hypothetical protein
VRDSYAVTISDRAHGASLVVTNDAHAGVHISAADGQDIRIREHAGTLAAWTQDGRVAAVDLATCEVLANLRTYL